MTIPALLFLTPRALPDRFSVPGQRLLYSIATGESSAMNLRVFEPMDGYTCGDIGDPCTHGAQAALNEPRAFIRFGTDGAVVTVENIQWDRRWFLSLDNKTRGRLRRLMPWLLGELVAASRALGAMEIRVPNAAHMFGPLEDRIPGLAQAAAWYDKWPARLGFRAGGEAPEPWAWRMVLRARAANPMDAILECAAPCVVASELVERAQEVMGLDVEVSPLSFESNADVEDDYADALQAEESARAASSQALRELCRESLAAAWRAHEIAQATDAPWLAPYLYPGHIDRAQEWVSTDGRLHVTQWDDHTIDGLRKIRAECMRFIQTHQARAVA